VDPATARVLGERAVPALGPGERSDGASASLAVPADLPAGRYHLAACADAPGSIVELEEQNNCSFSLIAWRSHVVPLHFEGVACTGSVGVGVPHDQSQGAPVNDGQLFDSTLP